MAPVGDKSKQRCFLCFQCIPFFNRLQRAIHTWNDLDRKAGLRPNIYVDEKPTKGSLVK